LSSKLKILAIIEIYVKNWNLSKIFKFSQKKVWILVKIETFVKNGNFGQKLKNNCKNEIDEKLVNDQRGQLSSGHKHCANLQNRRLRRSCLKTKIRNIKIIKQEFE